MKRSNPAAAEFRRRLRAGAPLVGTFIKLPGPHATEIIAGAGFDFGVIDCEHGPFDRASAGVAILAARANGMAAIARVETAMPHHLGAALDEGASGLLVPHVRSTATARQVVEACRYRFARGFSNTTRAGHYGARALWEHVDETDDEVTIIAMIEDPEATEDIADIVAVDGIDGIFIGRADLAVAMNDRQPGAPGVADATNKVIAACRAAGKPVCLMVQDEHEARALHAAGVSVFIVGSDQGFMRAAAAGACARMRSTLASTSREPVELPQE